MTSTNDKKKKIGRPQKFTTATLKKFIEAYIEKNHNEIMKLYPSRIAKYIKETTGFNIHYQDFTRNEDIMIYVNELNLRLKKELTRGTNQENTPVYTKINTKELLAKNNTPEKLQKALELIESNIEIVHKKYGEQQDKLVQAKENNLRMKNELEISKKEHLRLKSSYANIIKQQNKRIIELEKKNKILRSKSKIYEEFLKKHHYETLTEYTLHLEGVITSEVKLDDENVINSEDYKRGNYDLSEVIKSYDSIVLNSMTDVINQELVENDFDKEIEYGEEGQRGHLISLLSGDHNDEKNNKDEFMDNSNKGDSKLLKDDIFDIFNQYK
ncbi:hypothetical protein M3181_21955 [Mesobacillus maritimus]|uniref:hypothetical protein n=1 Tax=Mesobacillus maritimus TaxID=1643336 RepID=UPI00203FB932|nr:hypothetical protein [Mesobacillus maritimus]MCM3671624.1 hypothetical protein [Mesobacillus maritimus]